MNLSSFQEEQAASQEAETLLRVTLHEHAPQEVDLEQGWTTVVPRLASLDSKSQPLPGPRLVASKILHLPPRRKSWALAAVAALLLALLGASFANVFGGLSNGNTNTPIAYAAINQSVQVNNGIKLTAVKGYADPKYLVLYYDVQLPKNRSAYVTALVSKSTIQGKNVMGMCSWSSNRGNVNPVSHCAIIVQSGGNIAGNVLAVTWHISELRLFSFSKEGYNRMPRIDGSWTMHFTIPFHHTVKNPLPLSFQG